MKKLIAISAAIIAALALVVVGIVAPAVAGGSGITKYGEVFTYNGSNSWTIQNTDNDQAIKDVGNTTNTTLCSNYDTGLGKPCANGASYTFAGDTSVKGYDCAYVQLDGGSYGSQDTVPGESDKSVCVPTTNTADAAAAITTTAASCISASTVSEGTITNATWAAVVYSGMNNADYTAVATAASGHAFPAGTGVSADGSTETFSGTLVAQLTSGCASKVCIPDSSVSYTYSNNDKNTGIITVTDVANSTGELCHPFYVTATSWKYTNNASIWPQTVDVVDQLGKISTPGTYPYAAQVTCGQGDIYASTDATAPSLNPANYPKNTGQLLNPNTPFAEHFLSDMGFTITGGHNPTYVQDANSCFVPASETGIPTPSSATCAAPNANALTLPVVPGGQWTISNTGYSKTYSAATETDITSVPNGYAQYTIVLSDASNSDGYSVATKTTSWSPVDISTVDCNTQVNPASPVFNDVVNCTNGTIVLTPTTGVTYYLDNTKLAAGTTTIQNLTGSHTVTATADSGYEFAAGSYPAGGWTKDLGSTATCAIPYVLDGCTYDSTSGTSSQDVTLTFDNTGSKSSTDFQVNGTTYTVDAGVSETKNVGPITSAGGTINVYINEAATPYVVTVPSFDTCIPVLAGDPDVQQLSCDAVTGATNVDGEISVKLDPNLVYTITGPTGTDSKVITPVTAPVTDLAAGDYVVSVVALQGYVLTGPTSWPLTVKIQPTACSLTPTSIAASCTGPASSPTEALGQINVVLNANIDYTVTGGAIVGGQVLTAASTSFPDGDYTLTATLTAAAQTAGYRLVGDTTWGPFDFAKLCLPILPAWHANATGTDATCSATGATDGYISLQHLASEKGDVKYSIKNDVTGKVQNVGHTVSKVTEVPGSYTVTASPVNPKDGISTQTVFDIVIGAATAGCGTLAFTGGGFAGYLGLSFALGMLFLGAAALWMRRRFGARTAR